MERIDLSGLGLKDVHGHVVGVVDSFYLSKRELELLGSRKVCGKCGNAFVRGEDELDSAKYAEKGGRLKPMLELFDKGSIIDVKVKDNSIPSDAPMVQLAVAYGLQGFNNFLCPACADGNKEVHDMDITVSPDSNRRARFREE